MNRSAIVAALSVVLNVFLFFFLLRSCGHDKLPCDESGIVHVTHDTTISYVYADTVMRQIVHHTPKPIRVKESITDQSEVAGLSDQCLHTDTAIYADSFYEANKFRAAINDTITSNRIIGRSVWWADLKPTEIKTITNTISIVKKQPLIKVYAGADLYSRVTPLFAFDIAPALSVVVSDRYMIDAGYKLFDHEIQCGFKAKLSFKK